MVLLAVKTNQRSPNAIVPGKRKNLRRSAIGEDEPERI